MDAWRTACPRLLVCEEANDRGLILHYRIGARAMVGLAPAGRQFLEHHH